MIINRQKRPRRRLRPINRRPILERMEQRTLLATFTVLNTADTGVGSLRSAMTSANAATTASLINFNIPTTDLNYSGGVFTITPASPLPALTGTAGTTIDGLSETYFDAVNNANPNGPEVALDGKNAGATADGIQVSSANNQVLGLTIESFGGRGIAVLSGANNKIEANSITGNGGDGVQITGGATGGTVGAYWDKVIDKDHTDVVGITYAGGHWTQTVEDRDVGKGLGTSYSPWKVLNSVNSFARTTQPAGSTYAFIGGTPGQQIWVLPQQQNPNIIYAGANSLRIDPNTFAAYTPNDARVPQGAPFQWLKAQVTAVRGPGQFSMWQDGDPDPTVWVSTANGLDSTDAIYIPVDGHIHYNWGFTKAGIYEVDFQVSGYLDNNHNGTLDAGDTFTQSASVPRIFEVESSAPDPSLGNVIGSNGGAGVSVLGNSTTGDKVAINSFTANTGPSIDLGGDGVTADDPLDPDLGPNGLQNFPMMTSFTTGTTTTVGGTLNSNPSKTYTLDFYASTAATFTGVRYLGAATVTTNASGIANFTTTIAASSTAGEIITATATDSTGSTSEMSTPLLVQPSRFAATNTGFRLTLNEDYDPSAVAIYANDGSAPSVTLKNASNNLVQGTLVLQAANPGIAGENLAIGKHVVTFVATSSGLTGGVLPAGTYTARLKAGANGFIDRLGYALDGNSDGLPGGDYVTTFTVAARPSNGVVVGVPDFVRGAGQPVNLPGDSAYGLPVTLASAAGGTVAGVRSFSAALSWDNSLLTISTIGLGPDAPAGSTASLSAVTARSAVVTFSSPTPFAVGASPLDLVKLMASVPNGAAYGNKAVIDVSTTTVNVGATTVPSFDSDSVQVAAYLGDVDGDQSFSANDVATIDAVAVAAQVGFDAFPNADPNLIGDLDGDGGLTANDTFSSASLAVGDTASTPQIPTLPGVAGSVPQGGPDPLVLLPRGLAVKPGQTFSVPVGFKQTNSSTIALHSADLVIGYDPKLVAVEGIVSGSLLSGGILVWRADAELGLVYVSISVGNLGQKALDPGATGTLVVLQFRANPGASGISPLNLRADGMIGGSIRRTRLNEGNLTLVPPPTNADDDVVDGTVLVSSANAPSPSANRLLDAALAQYSGPSDLIDPLLVSGGDESLLPRDVARRKKSLLFARP